MSYNRKNIINLYNNVKKLYDIVQKELKDLDESFDKTCREMNKLWLDNSKLFILTYTVCKCCPLYDGTYNCKFNCVVEHDCVEYYNEDNYIEWLNCDKCGNEEHYLYKSKCKPKKWLCEDCLANIHDVKEFPDDKYVADFKILYNNIYNDNKLLYSSIYDFTELQDAKYKLETDNTLFKNALINNKRATYKNKYYDHTENYDKYYSFI